MKKKYWIILTLAITYIVFAQSCMRMRMSDKEAKLAFDSSHISLETSTIKINGKDFHYVHTGNDTLPRIIFIHGSPGSWDAYKAFLKDSSLLANFSMYAVDRLGFGYSNFGKAESLAVHRDAVISFIRTIAKNKLVFLVGHSYGGPCAVDIASTYPNEIAGITILSGSVSPYLENPEKWRLVFMFSPIALLVPGALKPSNEELWMLKKDLIRLEPNIKNLTCRALLIHGSKDRLVPFANIKFMEENMVNAKELKTITIKDADHFIPWSHYQIVKPAILEFFKNKQ